MKAQSRIEVQQVFRSVRAGATIRVLSVARSDVDGLSEKSLIRSNYRMTWHTVASPFHSAVAFNAYPFSNLSPLVELPTV
jgi:hypothetical protein